MRSRADGGPPSAGPRQRTGTTPPRCETVQRVRPSRPRGHPPPPHDHRRMGRHRPRLRARPRWPASPARACSTGSGPASRPCPGSESQAGRAILSEAEHTGTQITLSRPRRRPRRPGAGDRGSGEALQPAHADLTAIAGVDTVVDPFLLPGTITNPAAAGLVSTAKDGFLVVVMLDHGLDDEAEQTAHDAVVDRLDALPGELADVAPGVTGIASSTPIFAQEIVDQVREDLVTGEVVALPVALLIMVVVFGGFLAAGIPLVGALASIVGGLGVVLALTYAMDIDSFVINVVTVLGLGLSVDYGLLIVSRFREEAHRLTAAASAAAAETPATGLRRRRRRRRRPARRAGRARRPWRPPDGRSPSPRSPSPSPSRACSSCARRCCARSPRRAWPSCCSRCSPRSPSCPRCSRCSARGCCRPSVLSRVPGLRRLVSGLGDVAPEEGVFSRLARRVHDHPWLVLVGSLAVLGRAGLPRGRAADAQLHRRAAALGLPPARVPEHPGRGLPRRRRPGRHRRRQDRRPGRRRAGRADRRRAATSRRSPRRSRSSGYSVLSVFVDTDDAGSAEAAAVVRRHPRPRPGLPHLGGRARRPTRSTSTPRSSRACRWPAASSSSPSWC